MSKPNIHGLCEYYFVVASGLSVNFYVLTDIKTLLRAFYFVYS